MPRKKKEDKEHIAFVISPIGEPNSPERTRADQILEYIVSPVVSEFGYKAVRSDKISKPGIITTQIINHIINDPLVVADLTGHNPNVFYELAIRHAIRKPVIQLIKKGEKIPFDVSTQRTIQVDHKDLDSVDESKKELTKQIKAVEKDPTLVDSPISLTVDLQVLKQSGNPTSKAIAEIRNTLEEMNTTVAQMKERLDRLRIPSHTAWVPVQTSTRSIPFDTATADIDWVKIIKDLEKATKNLSPKSLESKSLPRKQTSKDKTDT